NFTAVIPKGQQFIGSIDAKELFNLVKLAEPFTSEKNLGISLWRNQDGSFGTTSEDGTLGSSEHNIKPNAKPVGRYQPQFLMDAANSLLRMGNDKIDIYHTDQLVPVEMRGKNAQVVIMPMRLEGETVAALPRSKTPPAHPEPLPEPVASAKNIAFIGNADAGEKSGTRMVLFTCHLKKGAEDGGEKNPGSKVEGYLNGKYKRGWVVWKPSEPETKPTGMGGAVPEEFEQGQGRPTSNKNAVVDAERAQRGLPAMMAALKRTWGEAWTQAMAKIDSDPDWQDRLIEELRSKPRPVTDMENAGLLHRRVDLTNELEKSMREAAQAYDDGRMDAVNSEKPLTEAFDQISQDLRSQYTLGYYPTNTARDGKFRKIKVDMSNHDLKVLARKGYYAPKE